MLWTIFERWAQSLKGIASGSTEPILNSSKSCSPEIYPTKIVLLIKHSQYSFDVLGSEDVFNLKRRNKMCRVRPPVEQLFVVRYKNSCQSHTMKEGGKKRHTFPGYLRRKTLFKRPVALFVG